MAPEAPEDRPRDPAEDRSDGPPAQGSPDPRRARLGWALTGVGLAAIVVAALTLASAGYGTRVRRGFADRRSYDMVKPAVQRAFPIVALTGLAGLTLVIAGTRLRRPASGDGGPSAPR